MAALKVEFNCGCGYKTPDTEEAKSHSDATGHAVHATALVLPTVRGANYKSDSHGEGQHVVHPKAVVIGSGPTVVASNPRQSKMIAMEADFSL